MATTALREAERFLYLHPHATTDVDNPVELLRDVTVEAEALAERVDELEGLDDVSDELDQTRKDLREAEGRIKRLIAFVRNLHAQQKICDLELRTALGT